jgi:protein-disulfide isomerase
MLKKTLLALTLIPSLVLANEAYEPTESFKKTIETYLTPTFVKSISYFETDLDFIGVGVVTQQYKKMVFYTDDKASFLINGNLINTKSGEQLTAKYNEQIEIDLTDIAGDFEAAAGFTQGEGDNTVYVVVDTNCGYCHQAYKSFQQRLAKSNKNLKIKWVPVGFLGQDSSNKGNILASAQSNEEGLALLDDYMNRKPAKRTSSVTAKGQDDLIQNGLIMKKYGYGGVPLVISHVDDEWFIFNGNPRANYFAKLDESLKAKKVATTDTPKKEMAN